MSVSLTDILRRCLDWLGRSREARRCRAFKTRHEAVAVVKALLGQRTGAVPA